MPNDGIFREPPSVTCFICGRKFGTASIGIHQKSCVKKWEATEALKPKRERRPVPKPPVINDDPINPMTAKEYNDAAFEHWNKTVLIACPHCTRTFLPDRLEIHLRSCRAGAKVYSPSQRNQEASPSSQGQSPSKATTSAKPPPAVTAPAKPSPQVAAAPLTAKNTQAQGPVGRPVSVVCYICGRDFGTKSISIHLKSCMKKWEDTEAAKEPHLRRPLPHQPSGWDASPSNNKQMSAAHREAMNQEALNTFQTEALVACKYCGRTFMPDPLEIHLRSCKATSPAIKKMPSRNAEPTLLPRPTEPPPDSVSKQKPTSSRKEQIKETPVETVSKPKPTRNTETASKSRTESTEDMFKRIAIDKWTVSDVSDFFKSLQLPSEVERSTVSLVKTEAVDGAVLKSLTESELVSELMLTKLVARKVGLAIENHRRP